jgi:beta-glucanase (GH16 family)
VVVRLSGRLPTWAAAGRRLLAMIVRQCRPQVVLAMAIALIVQGANMTSGRHDADHDQSAAVDTTMPEVGRRGLVRPSTWRRTAPKRTPAQPPASRPPTGWVTRISAGSSPLVDSAGHRWRSDSGYSGGRSAVTRAQIDGTSSPRIYQRERWGMSVYTIPVPVPGTYVVVAYLAETKFSRPRQRVFDISAEGVVKASDVDIIQAVGRNHAHHVIFTAVVVDGRLDLGFTSKVDRAKVNGIEVTFLRPSTAASRLVWKDEFDGPRNAPVDGARWRHEVGGAWGDGELQSYTARTTNAYQNGRGHLLITARAERFRGTDSIIRDYTSARISTKDRYSFQYGLFEARMQTPFGQGLWPAFWALGADIDRSGWPECGEIDVMEQFGHEPEKTLGTIHGPRHTDGGQSDYEPGYSFAHSSPLSQGFHTYGVQWLPGSVQFQVDGHPYGTVTQADLPAGSRWVFDHPFYLILNVAVGGRWAGKPDSSTQFPQALVVDYVRVYQ